MRLRALQLFLSVSLLSAGCVERAARVEAPRPAPEASRPAPEARPKVRAAAPVENPRLHLVRTSGSAVGPIPYLTVEPADARPDTPLVIALHGRGSRAESFSRLAESMRVPARFIVGRAPLPWGQTGGRQWFGPTRSAPFEGIEDRIRELGTLIDQLERRYPRAPKPIVMGFSQGAILAMELAAAMPARLGGVLAFSGAMPIERPGVKAARPVPMLLTAGEHDTLIPPSATEAARDRLRALGHTPELLIFDGAHSIPRDVLERGRAFIRSMDQRGG